MTDPQGIPLGVGLSAANVNDHKRAIETLEAIPSVAGRAGRPRRRPDVVFADKGYNVEAVREGIAALGIDPRIPRRADRSTPIGRKRWIVERTFAWINQFRRLKVRYELFAENYVGFLRLACAVIALGFLG